MLNSKRITQTLSTDKLYVKYDEELRGNFILLKKKNNTCFFVKEQELHDSVVDVCNNVENYFGNGFDFIGENMFEKAIMKIANRYDL